MTNQHYYSSQPTINSFPTTVPVGSGWIGSWRFSVERKAFSSQEITKRYNDQAMRWPSKLSRLGIADSYNELALMNKKRLAPTTNQPPALRILDCRIGTAELPLALSRIYPSSVELCAIDLSPDMLTRAELALSEAGVSAELEVADVRKLPYASNSFDLVVATHVLEHLPEPSAALAEISRVLKPNGLMLTCCTRRSLLSSMIQMKWRTHAVTQHQLKDWLSALEFHHIEFASAGQHSLLDQLSLTCFAQKTTSFASAA